MKTIVLVATLFAVPAFAATRFELSANESRTIEMIGATAAWAVDASIVDVAAQGGKVVLYGRAAGTTKIVVVSITGQNAFDVVVAPRRGSSIATKTAPHANSATAEVRYSSAAREIHNNVTVTREDKTRRTEASARVVHHAAEPAGARARTSIPSVSYRIFTRGREVTLLDRDVDHSPLTLSNTPLRGIHYLDEHWRLHAGYTAYAAYQSFLIPVERQTVAGAGYAFRASKRSTLMPSVFAYREQGTVLSMLYRYDAAPAGAAPAGVAPAALGRRPPADAFTLTTELAYSRTSEAGNASALGGALQLAYDSRRDMVRADLRYRPADFAVPAVGNPRGFFGDASWIHSYGRGSTGSLAFSASDIANTRVLVASGDLDHRLNDVLSLTGGASWGSFGGARSVTIPAGVRLDFARGGIGAVYRYAQTATNRGGHGLRLSGRASLGRLYLSASADRQQNAPTLDLIFAERPDLALALSELGISATTPADVARALREHAVLAELGFIEGVTVDLAPMRTQLGFEAAWLGASASRQQLRARLLHNVVEGVATRSATTIATLTYARRLSAATDVFASYSWWRTERRGTAAHVQPIAEIGVRQRFDGVPSIFAGSGTISGVVFADEDLDGHSDGTGVAAEVELDGSRVERTKTDGSFVFERVPRGSHRVVARVPGRPEAYFTTPSRVEAEVGERIEFGVAATPARVFGTVTSDAGAGIAGVRVLLVRGNTQIAAMTAGDGTFALAAAPGEWQLSIAGDSVPAGYSLAGIEARAVTLDRARPLRTAHSLRAHRTVTGSGARPNAAIEIRSMQKTTRADEAGRFAIRALPAGEVTLVVGGVEHRLMIPEGPSSVVLDLAPPPAPAVRTVAEGERRDTMRYMVAIGAFRVRANAIETAARARRSGVEATIGENGALTLVRAGPYTSRAEADAAAGRLRRAGMDAVVMSGM